jgi:hypothetical protein
MAENSQPRYSGLYLASKHVLQKSIHTGKKNDSYKCVLPKDSSHKAIANIAEKAASLMGVAISSVFNTVKEYKSTIQAVSGNKKEGKEIREKKGELK